jgi:hypothetical protein
MLVGTVNMTAMLTDLSLDAFFQQAYIKTANGTNFLCNSSKVITSTKRLYYTLKAIKESRYSRTIDLFNAQHVTLTASAPLTAFVLEP